MEIAANQKIMDETKLEQASQVLKSSVARPWKLEQNTSGQASRQASRASRLRKLEQNNKTKIGPQNGIRKSRRAKMGLRSCCWSNQLHFFCPSSLPFGGSTVLSLTRGGLETF